MIGGSGHQLGPLSVTTTNSSTNQSSSLGDLNHSLGPSSTANGHHHYSSLASATSNNGGDHNGLDASSSSSVQGNTNSSNQTSPKSDTVYKLVDFVKTKAFNDMRINVDLYRNGQ